MTFAAQIARAYRQDRAGIYRYDEPARQWIGCTNTHFTKIPADFDDNHYSSARDMALIFLSHEKWNIPWSLGTPDYIIQLNMNSQQGSCIPIILCLHRKADFTMKAALVEKPELPLRQGHALVTGVTRDNTYIAVTMHWTELSNSCMYGQILLCSITHLKF